MIRRNNMLYKDLETYFLDSKYREFIKVSFGMTPS